MNIICVICSDLLVQTDDIFYTQCGHVFHVHCLNQWLDRSKTCPQCRENIMDNKIQRLFFTFSCNEVESTGFSIQERIDQIKYQNLIKEKEIKCVNSKNIILQKQNAGLRKEVRKVESEISQKNAAIHALKEQIKYFKEQSSECNNLKKEVQELKQKLEDLGSIQVLLNAPLNDVDEMIRKSRNPTTLITYISVLKKELMATLKKIKQLRIHVKRLQDELTKSNEECNSLLEERSRKMQLEEELAFCESKNMALQKRVSELEEILGIPDSSSSTQEILKPKSITNKPKGSTTNKSLRVESHSKEKTLKNSTPTKQRKEKVPTKNVSIAEEEVLSVEMDNSDVIAPEENSICSSPTDALPTAAKRQKMSVGSKESSDECSFNKSDSSKYTSHSSHLRSKKRKECVSSVRKEKHSSKSKDSNERIIDLT